MVLRKFIHTGVILLTVAFANHAGAVDRQGLNQHLVNAAEQALSLKSSQDPLRPELELVADGKGPYGTFCVFLSTRAQLAILPFLSMDDLLTLIELDTADHKPYRRRDPMNALSAEALAKSLTRLNAIAMYTIDQVETAEQWRQVSLVIRKTRSLLKVIVKREVYKRVIAPSADQASADNPTLILLGEAARGFSKNQPFREIEVFDEDTTKSIQTQLLNMISMLETRLYFVGEDLQISRMDRLSVSVQSLCERFFN
jgi:hypothetical protein